VTKHSKTQDTLGRRRLLRGLLGSTGLAMIATGLPASFLRAPLARAADPCGGDAQFLILAASDRGDPLNANCPGSYAHAGISHPDHPGFVETPIKLGEVTSSAAMLWSTLPAWVLNRTSFVHHATRSAVHSEMPKIMRLMGATQGNEMLPSLIAAQQAPCLATIQSHPVNIGRYVNLTAGGVALPRLAPTALKQLLTAGDSPLAHLRDLRDVYMDRIHDILKRDGTTEQRRYLDERAQSRADTRRLADDATSLFDLVVDDSAESELLAAVALFKLRVTPVVTTSLTFGGDNHSDAGLQEEIDQHEEGVQAIGTLMNVLETSGMQDQVTLAVLNVFGRNLVSDAAGGRDHWPKHSVSLIVGKAVRAGVVGGLAPEGTDFTCTGIDARSGKSVQGGGDVPYEETLAAVGKTIWAATGADRASIDDAITDGKVLDAALV